MIELEQYSKNSEIEEVKSKEEIVEKIYRQLKENKISFDETTLTQNHHALKNRLILDSAILTDTIEGIEKEPTFSWVETEKIIGRPSASRYENGWAFEYDNRKGRAVEVAREIGSLLTDNSEKEDIVEHIFHPEENMQRIKLDEIEGPSGPIYTVKDGTHRIAGIMTTGLKEIPCDVYRIKYPLENRTNDEHVADAWKKNIDLGLIQGKVEISEGKVQEYQLTVEKEVLPWIRTQSQNQLIQISRMYEKLYPNSLNNLDIPRDALVDPIANNYFMNGRWKEWKDKFSKLPRDANNFVIY